MKKREAIICLFAGLTTIQKVMDSPLLNADDKRDAIDEVQETCQRVFDTRKVCRMADSMDILDAIAERTIPIPAVVTATVLHGEPMK